MGYNIIHVPEVIRFALNDDIEICTILARGITQYCVGIGFGYKTYRIFHRAEY